MSFCPFDLKGSFLHLVSNNKKEQLPSEFGPLIFLNGLIFGHFASIILFVASLADIGGAKHYMF